MQWLFLTYCVCRFLMKLFTVFFFSFASKNWNYCLQESEWDFFQLLLIWLQFGSLQIAACQHFQTSLCLVFFRRCLRKVKMLLFEAFQQGILLGAEQTSCLPCAPLLPACFPGALLTGPEMHAGGWARLAQAAAGFTHAQAWCFQEAGQWQCWERAQTLPISIW